MPDALDFDLVREEYPERWARADPTAALIERLNVYGWRVTMPDSDDIHTVTIARDGVDLIGRCRVQSDSVVGPCKGYFYHEGPCSHLCTIAKADVVGDRDTMGQRIQIAEVPDDLEAARARELAEHDRERARADGGPRR